METDTITISKDHYKYLLSFHPKVPYGPDYCDGCCDKHFCTGHHHLFGRTATEHEREMMKEMMKRSRP